MELTDTPSQSGPGSNRNEEILHTLPRAPKLDPHHQMQFSVMLRTHLWVVVGVLPFCSGYSHSILSSTDKAIYCKSSLITTLFFLL